MKPHDNLPSFETGNLSNEEIDQVSADTHKLIDYLQGKYAKDIAEGGPDSLVSMDSLFKFFPKNNEEDIMLGNGLVLSLASVPEERTANPDLSADELLVADIIARETEAGMTIEAHDLSLRGDGVVVCRTDEVPIKDSRLATPEDIQRLVELLDSYSV